MHILVSFCNLRIPGLPALGLLDASTFEFQVLQLPSELPRFKGITGLAASERYVYAAVQASEALEGKGFCNPSSLLVFDRTDLTLLNHYVFQMVADIHSLWLVDDVLYVASTGTDEIAEVKMRDADVISEVVFWRPEPEAPREDLHHLNAIHGWNGDLLVAGFGKKAVWGSGQEVEPAWSTANNGFIIDITRGEKIASGIDQPHSLVTLDDTIAYCESQRMAVRVLGDTRVQHLPGYTRGLCMVGQKLFVATSIGRQVSKSTGRINNPAHLGTLAGKCTISRLSVDGFEIEETIDLGTYGQEVYALLPVENADKWPVAPETIWRDGAIRELVTALDQRTVWAIRTSKELDAREATIRDLQAQLEEHTANVQRTTEEVAQRDTTIRELQRQLVMMQNQLEGIQRERETLLQTVAEQAKQLGALVAKVEVMTSREDDLRAMLTRIEDHLLRRDDVILTTLYDLQATHAAAQLSGTDASKQIGYQQLIRRIRKVVHTTLPRDATVIAVSKGDNELLKLYGRRGWHFPQTREGVYAGYYPINSTAAIAHLEALRAKGADYLLFPQTTLWWLDHYVKFKQHLERRYRMVVRQEETCIIFALREPAAGGQATVWTEFEEVIAEYQSRFDRDPAILDWHTGVDLATVFPQQTIFSPPTADRDLPYLDHSIDIVVISSPDPALIAEADRVAQATVVTLTRMPGGGESALSLAVDWKVDRAAAELPTTSIIIPCYNGIAYTEACLTSLRETLPRHFRGEIIVVDDASTDETPTRLKRWSRLDKRLKVLRNRKNAGFITSCNRGARAATGDILIFLNNDTVLLPGWLPPLLRMFRDYPDAGAVGGKLIFPDGTLQEAGGVVFCDGSAANFGRGEQNIDAPLYNYLREVDYCSGALLATRRSLFEELGGFDARYRPGYYEDTDYCFSVREKGYRVYYQPESAIIHFEGGSSGTDLTRGVKRYQVVNQKKFFEKWESALKRQPERPGYSDLAAWQALALRTELKGVENR